MDEVPRKFKPGEVVMLVAGGPDMAVRGYESEMVACSWFDGAAHQTGVFPEQVLVHLAAPRALHRSTALRKSAPKKKTRKKAG